MMMMMCVCVMCVCAFYCGGVAVSPLPLLFFFVLPFFPSFFSSYSALECRRVMVIFFLPHRPRPHDRRRHVQAFFFFGPEEQKGGRRGDRPPRVSARARTPPNDDCHSDQVGLRCKPRVLLGHDPLSLGASHTDKGRRPRDRLPLDEGEPTAQACGRVGRRPNCAFPSSTLPHFMECRGFQTGGVLTGLCPPKQWETANPNDPPTPRWWCRRQSEPPYP